MPVDTDCFWAASNSSPDRLLIWLEPWAEEFSVERRSTVTFKMEQATGSGFLEADISDDHIVVWASGGELVQVYLDGALQDTASATIAVPTGLTKQMLTLLFDKFPEARLGGSGAKYQESTSLIGSFVAWARRLFGAG